MLELAPADVAEIRRQFPALEALVLHGSRARGDAHPGSDWDFAYIAAGLLDELALRALLADRLRTDDVDLLDLDRAGGLVRYRAARDGKVVFESHSGTFESFRLEAIRFWLDAAPVIRAGYADVLQSVGR